MTDITDFTKHQHIIEDHPDNEHSFSIKLIDKLSRLARIKLSDDEKKHFMKELEGVITWVDKLKELEEDDNPEPLEYEVISHKTQNSQINQCDDVLRHTETQYQCFVVPKIVEND